MKLDLWFASTRAGDHDQTVAFLREQGAENLCVSIDPIEGFHEYTFTLYADTDDDIQAVLRTLLYYNDRDPVQLRTWQAELPPLAREERRTSV